MIEKCFKKVSMGKYHQVKNFEIIKNKVIFLNELGDLFLDDLKIATEVKQFKLDEELICYSKSGYTIFFYDINVKENISSISSSGIGGGPIFDNKALILRYKIIPIRLDSISYELVDLTSKETLRTFPEIENMIAANRFNNYLMINESNRILKCIDLNKSDIRWSLESENRWSIFIGGDSEITLIREKAVDESLLSEPVKVISNRNGEIIDSISHLDVRLPNEDIGSKIPIPLQMGYLSKTKKIVGFRDDIFWVYDLADKKVITFRDMKEYSRQNQIETFKNGIINSDNASVLFLASNFYTKDECISKVFAFDINKQEIIWEYIFDLPENVVLNMTSPKVSEHLIAIKDSQNTLHVLERG